MTDGTPPSVNKEETKSRRLSLHRKTPSSGESAKSSTSNSSLSPRPSIRKALLQSPAKKAVGLLNAMSPSRRSSDNSPDVSSAAVALPEKRIEEGADHSSTADAAKAGAVTPEATRSLESLSMEDTRAASQDAPQKATPTPQPSNLPSVISGGKLAINRPTTRSPPRLPPRTLYEQMKPTPPKHIEDKDEGMVVDPSSSDPPPPPIIYEVEDSATSPPAFDSKNSWVTAPPAEPVDYNMWDDTNSVPLNMYNDENNVENGKSSLSALLAARELITET
jgi:hypothetical protein